MATSLIYENIAGNEIIIRTYADLIKVHYEQSRNLTIHLNRKTIKNVELFYSEVVFVFKRNKKDKYGIEECLKEFNIINNANDEYKMYLKLYEEIKSCYQKKIKNNEIDINVEKLRLEAKQGKHIGASRNIIFLLFIAIYSGIIDLIASTMVEAIRKYNFIIIVISLLILLYFISRELGKSMDTEGPKDIVLYISLGVLNDLKNEMTDDSKVQYNRCFFINDSKTPLVIRNGKGNHIIDVSTIRDLIRQINKLWN